MKTGLGRVAANGRVFDASFQRDPYAVYRHLQAEAPVVWEDHLRAWVVTRAEDVASVLRDPATFSSDRVGLARRRVRDPRLRRLYDTISKVMLQMDEPAHGRLRRLVHRAFQATAVESHEDDIRAIAASLLAPGATGGSMEFVEAFAVPLPILVIYDLVGIPAADRPTVKRWCDAFSIVALNVHARISDEELEAGCESADAFGAYIADKVEEARGSGATHLIATLAEAEANGEHLSMDELLANVLLLLNAGNETTTILLVNTMHELLLRPDVMERLRGDRSLIPAALEEVLRYRSPVQFLGRIATRDVHLGGRRIRRGDVVLAFIAAAGRDPERFEDPDAFDIARHPNPHLAFGSGPHVCAGLQLARLEARVAFEALFDTFERIELASRDLVYGPNLNLRCLERLPLRVVPR